MTIWTIFPMRRLLAIWLLGWSWVVAAAPVALVDMSGPINPASAEYLARALGDARERGAALLVLRLDTPGGLDSTTREMVRAILASPVPVATYVAPSGARAASAGTYLLMASHLAAMAPATNLGAATPVSLGPEPGQVPGQKPGEAGRQEVDKAAQPSAEALRRKVVQDAAAYLRSLAQLRGRNVDWAEKAVVEGASLSAEEALKQRVIDLVATDLPDLLRQADGRPVRIGEAEEQALKVADGQVYGIERNWQERLLGTIADPNIALLLVMLGMYGLIFEFYNPGTALSGVAGAICLLLGAYGLHVLPVTYVGVLLIVLGIAFMVAEAFLPTFGALGIGGVIAFVAGSLMLVDPELAPGVTVAWQLVVPLAVVSAILLFTVGAMALKSRRRQVVSGTTIMVGGPVEAVDDFTGEGWVLTAGERWHAVCSEPVRRGEPLRVVAVDGLTVTVEKRKGE